MTADRRHAMDVFLRAHTRFNWHTHPDVYCSRTYLIDCLERVLRDDRHTTTTVRDLLLPHTFIVARDVSAFWQRLLALTAMMVDAREAPHVMVAAGRHILTWSAARLCLYTKTLPRGDNARPPPEPRWFARRLAPAPVSVLILPIPSCRSLWMHPTTSSAFPKPSCAPLPSQAVASHPPLLNCGTRCLRSPCAPMCMLPCQAPRLPRRMRR